ncbi:helix-turn-helix domain-containing protein [Bailinhaonella thermotolerans]|uniref:XRE family transcriptional regulator n=1 Tax=Bailinhaonella thermotolerans TaxID=1070861 RepID=A0A3A4AL74_9ACTN|nr:helix-turn-helix transcriptional regulator [Bailinhaonella thermotolerans]RJL26533.1 XRE family transcriptional regulator [Bailinhaonella thermotolerans]
MTVGPSPTVRRRRLGIELRRLREAAGLTCEEVGERLEWSASKVSRMETGRVRVHPRDVQDLLDLYDVRDDGVREGLVGVARESRQRGWWHVFSDVLPPWFEVYVGLEAEAESVRTFEMHVIPGLLQTEAYAQAIFRAAYRAGETGTEERRTRLRMARQEALTREPPLRLTAVIDEAVLYRCVGGPEVMRNQMARLCEAAALPNVTLQVLPLAAGAHPAMEGAFSILEFGRPEDADVVYLEHTMGGLYLERDAEVRGYGVVFEALSAAALSPEESTALLRSVARNYGSEFGGSGEWSMPPGAGVAAAVDRETASRSRAAEAEC